MNNTSAALNEANHTLTPVPLTLQAAEELVGTAAVARNTAEESERVASTAAANVTLTAVGADIEPGGSRIESLHLAAEAVNILD